MSKCRIINGRFGGRFINIPKTNLTRPTSDIVKQSLFNVLIHRFDVDFSQFCVIDCFAGSGSLGLEAVSLGGINCLFIDSNEIAIRCLYGNVQALGLLDDQVCIRRALLEKIPDSYLLNFTRDFKNVIIFMDPPYKEKMLLLKQFERLSRIFFDKHFIFVIETDISDIIEDNKFLLHTTKFGNTFINILKNF